LAATNFVFSVKDNQNITSSTTSTVNFLIYPRITATANTTARLLEISNPIVGTFQPLTAANGSGTYTYACTPNIAGYGVTFNSSTGAITGTPNTSAAAQDFVFSVKDSLGISAATTSTVNVISYNQITATANTTARLLELTNAIVGTFQPLVAVNGSGTYTYSVAPDITTYGLTFNTSTGVITGTPTTAAAAQDFVFSVKDSLGVSAATTSTVSVPIYARVVATANPQTQLLEVSQATPGTYQPIFVSFGGSGTPVYSVSPALSTYGLTYNTSTGLVSGTPTSSLAATNFVFSVKDSIGVSAATTSTVSFTIYARTTATALTTAQVLEVSLATAGTFKPLTAANGNGVYTYSVSPALSTYGLTYNTSTGLVSGTPTSSLAATNFVFSVVDGLGVSAVATSTVSFTIYSKITATANQTAQNYTYNTAITPFSPLTAANGTGTYTYSITSGTLPAGLSLDASTGVISGTPTQWQVAGNVTFSVKDSFNVVAAVTSTVAFAVGRGVVTLNYVLIGGGGGGGSAYLTGSYGGGGGGGGGYVTGTYNQNASTVLSASAGGAGAGGSLALGGGSTGSASTLTGATSAGGGGGGSGRGTSSGVVAAKSGACGGGGSNGLTFGTGSPGYNGGTSGGTAGAGGGGFAGLGFSTGTAAGVGGNGGAAGPAWPYYSSFAFGPGGGAGGGSLGYNVGNGHTGYGAGGNGGGNYSGPATAGSAGNSGAVMLCVPTGQFSGIYTNATTATGTVAGTTVIIFTGAGTYTV
jgi:hypothetical protein